MAKNVDSWKKFEAIAELKRKVAFCWRGSNVGVSNQVSIYCLWLRGVGVSLIV